MSDENAISKWLAINGLDELGELAFNLNWSWNHQADWLWEYLDADLWQASQNPWVVLQTISRDTLEAALSEPEFRGRVDALCAKNRDANTQPAWFETEHADAKLTVAYFSMEFMLTEALPIYSGGLGNVAGDQLKSASDLGVPVVGVSLLYGQGYFRQDFDAAGNQTVLYPINDPGQLPIRPLRHPNGEWLRLQIQMPQGKIWIRCWEASVGRTKLYLLDANDFANSAADRGITSQLYGGNAELRLKQEIILGIGGWRLLRALDVQPEVCHLNEGHAAFAILERARSYMENHSCDFELALNVTRAGNIFTTHTAVAAGFDLFEPDLIGKYLARYAQDELALSKDALLALGRQNPTDAREPFNMAYLAVHGSGKINGVSELHGAVSRQIFAPLFPRWPQEEVPIGSVTNGIHVATWDSVASDALWTNAYGKGRWRGDIPKPDAMELVDDAAIYEMRTENRKVLVRNIRKRYARQLESQGADIAPAVNIFDDSVLTIGFARRFATYKRPNLLLHDPQRLVRLLANPRFPAQLVLAGKAHPQDVAGHALIAQWNAFIAQSEVRSRVVFLSDYDMLMAQDLVQGVDLWINTPRRPWEACGTSGMKVLVNGGLNLSELDGWWAEAYASDVGWAIGDGQEHGEDAALDAAEAAAMYTLLEREIIPDFYAGAGAGSSARWLGKIRASMAQLTPRFSATRAIQEYTRDYYLPAAAAYRERTTPQNGLAKSLVAWELDIVNHWSSVRIENAHVVTRNDDYVFGLELRSGTLDKDALRVELYARPNSGAGAILEPMTLERSAVGMGASAIYSLSIKATRPVTDYTMRVVPYHIGASVPLEATRILWQR